MDLFRRDVIPVTTAFVLFVAMALSWWRHPAPSKPPAGSADSFKRHLLVTFGGGYVAFLAVVLVFHVWIAGQRGALRSAANGGAFLAFVVAMPLSIVAEWVSRRRSRAER